MCLATSQIGYSWIMRPSTLPHTYVNFLNRHGGREAWHYAAVRVRALTCFPATYLNGHRVKMPQPVICTLHSNLIMNSGMSTASRLR